MKPRPGPELRQRWAPERKARRTLVVWVVYLLGCAPVAGSWPVLHEYDDACLPWALIPTRPFCLNEFAAGEGFQWAGQFEACRQTVANYLAALKRWRECRIGTVHSTARKIESEATEVLSCRERETPRAPGSREACGGVESSFTAIRIYDMDIVPPCLRSDWQYAFEQLSVERCRENFENSLAGM